MISWFIHQSTDGKSENELICKYLDYLISLFLGYIDRRLNVPWTKYSGDTLPLFFFNHYKDYFHCQLMYWLTRQLLLIY